MSSTETFEQGEKQMQKTEREATLGCFRWRKLVAKSREPSSNRCDSWNFQPKKSIFLFFLNSAAQLLPKRTQKKHLQNDCENQSFSSVFNEKLAGILSWRLQWIFWPNSSLDSIFPILLSLRDFLRDLCSTVKLHTCLLVRWSWRGTQENVQKKWFRSSVRKFAKNDGSTKPQNRLMQQKQLSCTFKKQPPQCTACVNTAVNTWLVCLFCILLRRHLAGRQHYKSARELSSLFDWWF